MGNYDVLLDAFASVTKLQKEDFQKQIEEGLGEGESISLDTAKSVLGKVIASKTTAQHKRGLKEGAEKIEKAIKTIEGFSSENTGESLVSDLDSYFNGIKESSKGELDTEKVMQRPDVLEAIKTAENKVREAWETKHQSEVAKLQAKNKELNQSTVMSWIENTLIEGGAKVTDDKGGFDPLKRAAIKKLASGLNLVPTESGMQLISEDGKVLTDPINGEPVDPTKTVLETVNVWGYKDVRDDRNGAGGKGSKKEESESKYTFKTAEEYGKFVARRDVSVEEKEAAQKAWKEQQQKE